MKRLLIVALSLVAVFAFVGCSGNQASESNQASLQAAKLTPQEYLDEVKPIVLEMTAAHKNDLRQMLDIVSDGNSDLSFELYQKIAKACDPVIDFEGAPEEAMLLHTYFMSAASSEQAAAFSLYMAADKVKSSPSEASKYVNDATDYINSFGSSIEQANDALLDFKEKTGAE